jgi:hypothetical protein
MDWVFIILIFYHYLFLRWTRYDIIDFLLSPSLSCFNADVIALQYFYTALTRWHIPSPDNADKTISDAFDPVNNYRRRLKYRFMNYSQFFLLKISSAIAAEKRKSAITIARCIAFYRHCAAGDLEHQMSSIDKFCFRWKKKFHFLLF